MYGEPGMPVESAWPQSLIRALFGRDLDAAQVFATACAQAGLSQPPAYHLETVEEQDWVRHSQSQFTPIRVSAKLWIVPSWTLAPDPGAINIVLDPGLAFGTGSHPSTRLCLRWLERTVRGGERVLDYGCGSGILAIAALRFGAHDALGVDIDPLALEAARANAARNRVDARFLSTETPPDIQANLVVANILANPLKLLAPLLAAHTGPGGRVALSGILEEQAEEVMVAYAPWFALHVRERDEGWVLIEGKRLKTREQV